MLDSWHFSSNETRVLILQNIERKKQKPGYNAYDEDELDEFGQPKNKILGKYDEEIEGEKKDGFVLGKLSSQSILFPFLFLFVSFFSSPFNVGT